VGVELSEWGVAYARREFGLEVYRGTLAERGFAHGSFDVAVMADVIEHLPDPVGEVRRIHALLRPGGLMLILTPDVGSLAARLAGRHWWALLDDHHCYFSAATIALLLRQCELELRWCRGLGRRFRLGHWVEKFSQYSRGLYHVADSVCGVLRLRNVPVYLNMFDQMACLAAKPTAAKNRRGVDAQR
jgi:SAM-dependent methyltransferase